MMRLYNRDLTKMEPGIVRMNIAMLRRMLPGITEQSFDAEHYTFDADYYTFLYTTIYNMCTKKHPYGYLQQLDDIDKDSLVEYVEFSVLPALPAKHEEFMVRKLVNRWKNHKKMVNWLSNFLKNLDVYITSRCSRPDVHEYNLIFFRDLFFYEAVKNTIEKAVISLIDREREGEQIDLPLLILNVREKMTRFRSEVLPMHIRHIVLPALCEICEEDDESRLRELMNRWNKYNRVVRWLSCFFKYFYRYFTLRPSLQAVNKVGLIRFRDLVYPELKTTVRNAVISLIDRERKGEQIDRALLKNALDIFVTIGMGNMDCYDSDFESAMLEDTAAYYSRKAASWILEDSCPDYMLKAEECLKREKERVSHYLQADSEQKLLGTVEHELLSQYENQLLEKEHSGCHSLLQDGKMDDLSRMYRLFCRIPKGLEPIAQFFKQHVTDEGTMLVKQAEDAASNKSEKKDIVGPLEQTFVREVIKLHDKYLQYVSTCFVTNSLFHKALKEAFEVFCNKGVAGNTSAELLATFCDNILKKGSSEKLSDEEIEELEKVVKLLAYIGDKDLFSEFYRKKLARRLIFDKSANDEHERSILTKLKQQCGGQFTSKMEGMLTDLTLARENQPKFQKYLDDNVHVHPGIELTVTVLTTGFWPSYKSFDLNLPAEMVRCVEVFKEFYQTQTKHRKLTWIYSLGTCNIFGNFNVRSVELIVTTYQGAALLLFNSAEKLSYSEIKSQLNLSDEDIIRLLHSLACLKHKILIKEPSTKTVTQSDYFEFNANFTDKSRKIEIPLPPVDEKKKIIENVVKDRRYAIDACIVRIMKSRKVLADAQLVTDRILKQSK